MNIPFNSLFRNHDYFPRTLESRCEPQQFGMPQHVHDLHLFLDQHSVFRLDHFDYFRGIRFSALLFDCSLDYSKATFSQLLV